MSADISVPIKLSYGVGQIAEGLKNTGFSVFVMFYYNQVLGLPGWLAGVALSIALVFDAVSDPVAGSLSDNWRSRLGRRHPFMYASAVPLGLAFLALFSPPDGLSDWGLFAWLAGTAILTRAAMTLYHVPHIALGAELSEDFRERTVIVAFRQAFGYLGALLTIAVGFGLFFRASGEFEKGQLDPGAYQPFALTLSLLMVLTILVSAWGTRSRIPYLPERSDRGGEGFGVLKMLGEYTEALRNRNFVWLFGGVIVIFVMVGVDQGLNLYMNTYFWEFSAAANTAYLMAAILGAIIGSFFTRILHDWWDKLPGVLFGATMWAVCQVVPVSLRLLDLLPANGDPVLVAFLIGVKFLQGLCVVQALISFNSMMADVVDEHELQTGARQEGVFFGAVSFSSKSTSGLGTLLAGLALSIIAWPTGADVRPEDVGADTLFRLGLVYGPLLSMLAAVSVWCYAHYDLDRERHRQIQRVLAQRRYQPMAIPGADGDAPRSGASGGTEADAAGSGAPPGAVGAPASR